MKKIGFLLLVLLLNFVVKAQQDTLKLPEGMNLKADTLKKVKKPLTKPQKAAIFSAILPGAGQVYNKKYWKVPIIYGGGGALFYLFSIEQTSLKVYRRAYLFKRSGIPLEDEYFTNFNIKTTARTGQFTNLNDFSEQQINSLKSASRTKRDTYVIGMLVLYLMNIIDASVDAHFKEFDLGDDISMKFEPGIIYANNIPAAGLGINFRIK